MRIAIAAILLATSSAAVAAIKIPYFKNLKETDVCGGIPSKCQPTSSQRWSKVKGLDYQGISMLGRKYGQTIFETSPCATKAISEGDVTRKGTASISGGLTSSGKSGFGLKANAQLEDSLKDLIGGLPEDLSAKAKSELSKVVNRATESNIELSYERVDLSQDFIDNHLSTCISQLSNSEKVITGLSVISTSGNWTRGRVSSFVLAIEGSAEFQSLSAEAKANWESKKTLALSGTFKPVTFVFAAAYRKRS